MPSRHLRTVGQTRRPRRQTTWCTLNTSAAIAAGAVQNFDMAPDLEVAGTSHVGCTVVRIHLSIQFPFAAADAGSDSWIIGIIVGRAADLVAGTTPDPVTSQDLRWMLNDQCQATRTNAGSTDLLKVYRIDLKSRRRMNGINDRLILVIKNNNTAVQTPFVFARSLVMLP
jgi:hypothetical protein